MSLDAAEDPHHHLWSPPAWGKIRYVLYLSMYIMSRTLPIYLDTKILPSFFLLSFFGAGGGTGGLPSVVLLSVGWVRLSPCELFAWGSVIVH